ncbi:hypothetical protein BT67DRAFT_271578 [Trichocladium antarcticum]|uniref:Uncharacterized protein n=1 Tax=Trichocladium antarcticum TaxID=1450529 RepID=A0AAN6ZF18_9PEZI|nr:hypothetical protein BT67DRAFT_271578 [Trichocladium antarcticum]
MASQSEAPSPDTRTLSSQGKEQMGVGGKGGWLFEGSHAQLHAASRRRWSAHSSSMALRKPASSKLRGTGTLSRGSCAGAACRLHSLQWRLPSADAPVATPNGTFPPHAHLQTWGGMVFVLQGDPVKNLILGRDGPEKARVRSCATGWWPDLEGVSYIRAGYLSNDTRKPGACPDQMHEPSAAR